MRQQRGYSLIEILAALAILGFVITVSMLAFVERNRRLQQASELILAYQALSNEAEYLRRTAYDDLEPTEDFETEDFESDTSLLYPLRPYTTEVEVEETSLGVKNVTMRIRWRDKQQSLTLVRVDTGGSNLW
jgi:prepilin-type N-terminal cleavage/methylation domain-containing protein